MKKTLTILSAILFTIISFNAKAQDDKPEIKSYIGILGGMAFAGGSFGSGNYNNNNAGFAKNGAVAGIDGAYYIYKNFGIGATFTFQDNGEISTFDAQTLATDYNNSYEKESTSITSKGRFHTSFLMVGPQYSFIVNKFIIDLRASAGIVKSWSTPITSVYFDDSSTSNIAPTQLSSTGRALAYGGSAGLRYNIIGNLDIGIKFNYVNSPGVFIPNLGYPDPAPGRYQTKLPITVLESTMGVTLHL